MKRRASASKIGTNISKGSSEIASKKPRIEQPSPLNPDQQVEKDSNLNPEALIEKYIEYEYENEATPLIPPHSPMRAPVRAASTIRPHSPSRALSPMRPQSPIRERGFFVRSIMLPELEASEASKGKKPKIAIDDLLLGASNPIIEKKKAFIDALDQIDSGSQSHPLLNEILQTPIPEVLSNLPKSAVLKARLNGQVKGIKSDQAYMDLQHELEIYAGLPLILDMIWSYFFQTKKLLVLKTSLEQHIMDSHTRIITRDAITESMQKLLEIAGEWCHIQVIDGKEYFKIIKKVEIFALTKKMIQDKYNSLDKNDLMVL